MEPDRGHAQPPVHAYFVVSLDRVWETLETDLPPLIAALEAALADSKEGA